MLCFRFEHWRILVVAALVAASVAVVALSPAASFEIRPLLESLGIISCSSSGPCEEGKNSSTGPGLEGISSKGTGVIGRTFFKSTNPSNGRAGMSGMDLSTSGTFDAGVMGTSTKGLGVLGTSTSGYGVQGSSISSHGVVGISTSGNGVQAISTSGYGVVAESTSNYGLFADSVNGPAINAFSQNAKAIYAAASDDATDSSTTHNSTLTGFGKSGVYGHDDSTDGGMLNVGVTGFSINGIGAQGVSNSSVGVNAVGGGVAPTEGEFPALSVAGNGGVSNSLIAACTTLNPCNAALAAFVVYTEGSIFVNNISANGVTTNSGTVNVTGQYQKNGMCLLGCTVATTTSPGRAVVTYASTVSQPTVEDFGEAQLVDGQARVQLDPKFANVVDQSSNYLVFITPEGDANTLYVTQKSLGGFIVRESHGGRSTLTFSYRIVAKPFGAREARLPMVALPKLHARASKPARRIHSHVLPVQR